LEEHITTVFRVEEEAKKEISIKQTVNRAHNMTKQKNVTVMKVEKRMGFCQQFMFNCMSRVLSRHVFKVVGIYQ
jgi:ABC-type enterochelin transport system substrate-binding protein